MTILDSLYLLAALGRKHVGKVRGASIMVAIGGSGPVVLGISHDYLAG